MHWEWEWEAVVAILALSGGDTTINVLVTFLALFFVLINILFLNLHISTWAAGQKVKQWIQNHGEAVRWMIETDGKFSTKSAYKALKEISDQMEINRIGEQADKRKAKQFWQTLWKLNVQPKVRLFAWRLFHDYLPSTDNLARRGMDELRKCPVCGLVGETTIHTLLYCWWAQVFWKRLRIECNFLECTFQGTGDWLWYCVFHHDKLEISLILQGARTIWLNRNSLLHGKNGQSSITTASYVCLQARSLYEGEEKLVVTELSEGGRWSKPRKGIVKVNVDGAWDRATKVAGVGIVCRDEEGNVYFVEAYPVGDVKSCLEAEQMALARAMRIMEEENISKVTFEIDCTHAMNGLMQGASLGDQNWELLQWCKDRLDDNNSCSQGGEYLRRFFG